jgi:hypothetical protein
MIISWPDSCAGRRKNANGRASHNLFWGKNKKSAPRCTGDVTLFHSVCIAQKLF